MGYRRSRRVCWYDTLWFLFFATIITLIVLAMVAPHHTHEYYRKSLQRDNFRIRSKNCKQSEVFDRDLEMCAPLTVTPVPINLELIDHTVRACDSFYRHMTGVWVRTHENENRGFGYVYRKNLKEVDAIVKDYKSGPIYDFYRSCLDTLVHGGHARESRDQIAHLTEQIVNAVRTHADLPIAFARLLKHGFHSPFTLTIVSNPTKSEMMPFFAYDTIPGYTDEITKHLNAWHVKSIDVPFIEYVTGPEFKADTIPMQKLINLAAPNFWEMYLTELNSASSLKSDLVGTQPAWVTDQRYFEQFFANINKFTVKQWRKYIGASIKYSSSDFMPLLPENSYFRAHELHSVERRLSSDVVMPKIHTEQKFTSEQCVTATHKLLPGLVSSEFLHRDIHNSEKTRARITRVVKNLRTAYAKLVESTPWMTNGTKTQTVDKIRNIIVRVMHPTVWETEPFATRITKDRYLRNLDMIRRHRVTRNLELWSDTRQSMNRDVIQRFGAPLTTVNAYYSPTTNTITVFAGIIQEPFYSDKFSDMAVYATLGMVCAHEFSHASDPTGRMFNAEGSLVKWWTDKDIAAFNMRAQCVIDEFESPSGCENAEYGEQTLGEDVADITGITIAWNAYITVHPDATRLERRQFFQVFAQMWAESFDQKHLCGRVQSDVHAIAQYRVDKTLRQMEPFHRAFGCQAGDNMVNVNKCRIYG